MKLVRWTARLVLVGAILVCVFLMQEERRKAEWYQQEIDALRASIEDIEVKDPSQLWLKYVTATPDATSLLYYIPAQRRLDVVYRNATLGSQETLMRVPATRVARSGLLQIEIQRSHEPGVSDRLRIYGLSERPALVEIPADEMIYEATYIGAQAKLGEPTTDEIMAMQPRYLRGVPMLSKLPYISHVFTSSHSTQAGLEFGNEYFLFRWRTQLRNVNLIQDGAGIISIAYVDEEVAADETNALPSSPLDDVDGDQ